MFIFLNVLISKRFSSEYTSMFNLANGRGCKMRAWQTFASVQFSDSSFLILEVAKHCLSEVL